MRQYFFVFCASLFLLLFVIGCEKSSNMATQPGNSMPVSQQNQAAMASLIAQDQLFTTDQTALSDAVPALAKTDTAILPRGWGRKIENATRSVSYNQLNDTTVIATVTNTLTGQVWIRIKQSPKDTIIYKPLSETIIHKVEFSQVPVFGFDSLRNWKMVAISGVQGGTNNGGLMIQNVTFYMNTDTVSVTNPLDSLFQVANMTHSRRWGVRELQPGSAASFRVQVTVKSTDPDSDIVVDHRPFWFSSGCSYRRASMALVSSVSNGDGTFTRVYQSDKWDWPSAFAGRYLVYVGAITRQSIYDNQAPFSSNIWAIPYVVE
jgi:hypothetical protein